MEFELEIPVGFDAVVTIPSGIKKYRLEGNVFDLSGAQTSVENVK